jgi:hypothetical protein
MNKLENSKDVVNSDRVSNNDMIVYDALSKKYSKIVVENKTNILKFIMNYLKSQLSNLSTRGPSKKVVWSSSTDLGFIESSGMEEEEIKKVIKSSNYIKPSWFIANKPSNIAFVFLICYFWNNQTKEEINTKNYKSTVVYILNLLFTIRFYSSLQQKFFKHEADEDLMNIVIEEISGRYKLKNMNNIYELLEYISYTNVNNTVNLMKKPTDANLCYFMNNLNGRISSVIKSIAKVYYEKFNKGERGGVDSVKKEDDERDIYLGIPPSVSNEIAEVTRRILIKLVSLNKTDETCLSIACKQTKAPIDKMRITFDKMREKDQELIGVLVSDILSYYLGILKFKRTTIRSISFLTIMKKIYSVSNTDSELIIKIKETLNELLKRNSTEYLKTNRVATLSTLRATVYLYFLLFINKYSE